MEIHVSPRLADKLTGLAAATGRAPDQIVEEALAGYLEELDATRKRLDNRYDDVKSDRVTTIDGDVAWRRLHEKSKRRRSDG